MAMNVLKTSASDVGIIEGAPLSGKTAALVERVKHLIDDGTAPEDVVVLGATPASAAAFARRLATQGIAEAVRVTTPREVAWEVLRTPDAQRLTGRDGRILSSFERDILVEDVKVCGMRPRRLSEMLKFFYRGMTQLDDWDESWLVSEEEATVFGLLKDNLAFMRGVLEPEISNLALRCLTEGEFEDFKCPHVLVDDFTLLSRASQALAAQLAGQSLWVAGCSEGAIEVFEPHPWQAGLADLAATNPEARTVRLDGCFAAASREVKTCSSPYDEFETVGALVQEWLSGASSCDKTYVACPNGTWQRNVAAALGARGVAHLSLAPADSFRCDTRDLRGSSAARQLTALRLIADPFDGVAWRSWCAFGDYLGNSAAVSAMRSWAAQRQLSFESALPLFVEQEAVAGDPSFAPLVEAYRRGRALVEGGAGLTGDALLSFVACAVDGSEGVIAPQILAALERGRSQQGERALAEAAVADEAAAELVARINRVLVLPGTEGANGASVVLGPLSGIAGFEADRVILCGAVNGFLPHAVCFDTVKKTDEQRRVMMQRCRDEVSFCLSRARDAACCTWFRELPASDAQALGVAVERYFVREGKRMASTAFSEAVSI